MTGIIAGLLLLAGCGSVAAPDRSGTYVPPDDPAGNIFVKDIGDVLDKATEQRIYGLNKSWESRKDKPQLLVVTLKSLDGDSIENKATELFDKYKPGEKSKDTGLLYLLSVEDRKDRLEVGYGLESVIPDADAADIIDTAHSDYKDGDWSKGVNKVVDGIETSIEDGSPTKYLTAQRKKEQAGGITIAVMLIVFFLGSCILVCRDFIRSGGHPSSLSSSDDGWSSLGSSSGGWSGGSSSDGGSSFGGGSSGGGGASGSW